MRASTYAPLILVGLALAACKGDEDDIPYEDPVANAGADQNVLLGATVSLDGSESFVCCNLQGSYTWTFLQTPVESAVDDAVFGTTNGTNAAEIMNWVPDVEGTYVVSLIVTDGITTSTEDLVVVDVGVDNLPPTADAGDDVSGRVGQRLCLDGSGSSDPEGQQLEYVWTIASVPSGSGIDSSDVYDADTATPCIVPDADGTYIMSLVVSDGTAFSEPDYAGIIAAAETSKPIADAGESKTLPPCVDATFQLNGFGSYDPDGNSLTYYWNLESPPAGSTASNANFDDQTLPNPKFQWDVEGSYTFSLQVFDGEEFSAIDIVTLTIPSAGSNNAPTANAGEDQEIDDEADCTSSDYEWTCGECAIAGFELDGSTSFDSDGDEVTYLWAESTGSVNIENPTLAWTRVFTPAVAATYGSTTTYTYTLDLTVSDCAYSDTDSVTVSVNCTGESP